MKDFFRKIAEIFKKVWFVVFIPIGMFFVSLFFNKQDSYVIKEEIKHTTQETKEEVKEVQKAKAKDEDTEKTVIEKNEDLKQTIESNLDDKESRDKEASKFFNF